MTRLLSDVARNDPRAAAQLLPLVYQELRQVARRHMEGERVNHTLQATALVHEVYQRLVRGDVPWNDRAHFFFAAANAMRDILIDHARSRNRQKRGGGAKRQAMDVTNVADLAAAEDPEPIVTLDRTMCRLGEVNEFAERVVRLRFFAGLSIEETAKSLAASESTVKRSWVFARAWLARELGPDMEH